MVDTFMESVHSVNLIGEREDTLLWKEGKKGRFQVKFFYNSMAQGISLFPRKEVWGSCPLSACLFSREAI